MLKLLSLARSTQVSGLAGAIAWAIALAYEHFTGKWVDWQTLTPCIVTLMTILAHIVPDTLVDHARDLNVDAQKLASVVPDIQSSPSSYPDSVDRIR